MKKVLVCLANGFELIEAMTPVDVLRRCGAEVYTLSIGEDLWVESSNRVLIKADLYAEEVNWEEGDVLILPGGYPGYVNLRESDYLVSKVKDFLEKGKWVAAICGAPTFFAKHRLALDFHITAHSSTKEEFIEHQYRNQPIVQDRNLITSIGAGHSLDFSFQIAKNLFSEEKIQEVKQGMEL